MQLKTQSVTKLKKKTIVIKLRHSNCDKTKKNQTVTKYTNSNWDKTYNKNCDKTGKFKL